jgi:hypothetical protein
MPQFLHIGDTVGKLGVCAIYNWAESSKVPS